MPNLAELQAERDSLLVRVAELERLLCAEGSTPAASRGAKPRTQGDGDWWADLLAAKAAEPYDPADWEEFERRFGIYEDIHGRAPA